MSGPGQAWAEWARGTPRPGAAERARAGDAEREAQQRADAERAASARGVSLADARIQAAANRIAQGLGFADQADEALRQLEREANDRGFGGVGRAARRTREALEGAEIIDPADRDYEPRDVPDGQPDVPSSCEGNAACRECYGTAMTGLDDTRYRLERLRAIYASTYSDAKAKIAFADGVSAVHGVSALAWQKYKAGVTQSLKGLDRAYDDKYAELMGTLLEDLQEVSSCEQRIMNVPNWYDRFGFIYYTFMKDRYKRPSL